MVSVTHACPECGREFESERTLRVHHSRKHGELLPSYECAHCGDWFDAEHERKYCSPSCRDAAVSREGEANPNYSDAVERTGCRLCGESFEYYPSSKKGHYCPACVEERDWRTTPSVSGEANSRWNGGKQAYSCVVCDKTVERYASEVTDTVVCSEDCRRKWLSEAFSGPGHPNWEGGENPAYGRGWNAVREQALQRDGYRCVVCGTTREELGRNPDVHHIVPVRWFAESDDHDLTDAHFPDNVVSLCPSCHRKAEFGKIERSELRDHTDDTYKKN